MRALLTGTSGFVGGALKRHFLSQGWRVRELQRVGNLTTPESDVVPFTLGGDVPTGVFSDVDVFIHCAYDFSARSWSNVKKVNVNGSLQLFSLAQKSGVKTNIFMSSLSAFDGCRSLYGKAKVEIENEVLRLGGCVIRPGLIFSDTGGGIFNQLKTLVRIFPVLPVVNSGALHLIHIDDLSQVIFKIAAQELPLPSTPLIVASPGSFSLREICQLIARSCDLKRIFIPVPFGALYWPLSLIEFLRIPQPMRSDSLLGLCHPNPRPDFSWMASVWMGKLQKEIKTLDGLKPLCSHYS